MYDVRQLLPAPAAFERAADLKVGFAALDVLTRSRAFCLCTDQFDLDKTRSLK
jgi:hypothetical protein